MDKTSNKYKVLECNFNIIPNTVIVFINILNFIFIFYIFNLILV